MSNTQALLSWLPRELHNAPGIDWSTLPSTLVNFCVKGVGESPDALPLAVAIASAFGQVSDASLLQMAHELHAFFHTMRSVCAMQSVSDLREEALWNDFEARTQVSYTRSRQLSCYSSVSTKHYPPFRASLEAAGSHLAHQDLFPPMPAGFLGRVGNAYALNTGSRKRQQPIREALVPLFPMLRQIVWERKQVAERLYKKALCRAMEGRVPPIAYEYADSIPSLEKEQGGAWGIKRREITLRFRLWTRRTWILAHRERYGESMIRDAKMGYHSSSPDWDWYFLQFEGASQDLLWFGDLVEAQLLRRLKPNSGNQEDEKRLRQARALGFTYGCSANPSDLLNPRSPWLTEHMQAGDLLLEPESLYRGILYGSALSLLALTNGGGVGELLQISLDRNVIDAVRYQLLLPDGAKVERSPFRITEEVSQLLLEIERGLTTAYGEVPTIAPFSQVSGVDRLHAERYLFQWEKHMLKISDVQTLVRFVLHGLALPCVEGQPLHITLDMLRDMRTPLAEAATTKQRSQVLQDTFGFTQDVVTGLSPASRDMYCHDFYAFYQFAGSREAALQQETLQRWREHLLANYKTGTVKRMVDEVRSILRAAAERGYVERGTIGAQNLLHERSQVLQDAFGFTHDVVTGLSPVARKIYCNDFLAYSQFAGSKEAALQWETLQRWRDHLLREEHYKAGTVNRMIRTVESILRSAAAQGYIDPDATALQSM